MPTETPSPEEIRAIYAACTRSLGGDAPHSRDPQVILKGLAAFVEADTSGDVYGTGDILANLETEVATLLGHEAAIFMPSGTMAQQIALRLWAERKGTFNVAFHPLCHLEIHEDKAYQKLHGLHGILLGGHDRLLTMDDLQRIREPLAALLIELPQREIGGQLPPWDELQAIALWARERGAALHMDGARLWESQPFYGRPYSEIAGLFDSVYVSFYKGLAGIAGAALAGPADFIREARLWQHRQGGLLPSIYPLALAAHKGLKERLPQMPAFCAKAQEIAAVLRAFPEVLIVPDPPHTNMMHLFIRAERERLEAAALHMAREHSVRLLGWTRASILPGFQRMELSMATGAQAFTAEEVRVLYRAMLDHAAQ